MKRRIALSLGVALALASALHAQLPPAPVLGMPGSSQPLAPFPFPAPSASLNLVTNLSSSGPAPLQMQILVLGVDPGEYSYESITTFLTQIGVPYTAIAVDTLTPDSNGNRLDSLTLSNSQGQGLYQGIIETNSTFSVCNPTCTNYLSSSDFAKIDNYATQFNVRLVTYYTYPNPRWGLVLENEGASYTASNPLNVTVTTAGQSVFSYINAANPIPVAGSGTGSIYAYTSAATAATGETTTPILMAGSSVVGVTHTTASGEQSLSLTFDNFPTLIHSLAFSYGVINWVTRGVFIGARQIYLNIQDDDILYGDRLYAPTLPQCPAANTCPDVQTSPTDLQALLNWQNAKHQDPQLPYIRTSFAYVGIGSTFGAANVEEAQTMTQMANDYGWINHTWTHGNPDCFTMSPSGTCIYATIAEGLSDIELNSVYGASIGLPTDTTGFVTPFNTGLDNQAYLTAAAWEGITSVISAAAPPSTNTGAFSPLVPSLYVVPRLVTNENADEDSPDTGVYGSFPDEYNAMYGPDGTDPVFTTNQTYTQIINNESTNLLLLNFLTYSPYPLGFHTSNSVAYDGVHSIMTDLFDAAFTKYEAIYNLPIYTLQAMRDQAPLMLARQTLNSSGVTGLYTPGVGVTLTTVNGGVIPMTGACSQANCPTYGGQMQDYVSMGAGSTVTLSLTAGVGPGISSVLLTPSSTTSASPVVGVISLNGIAQSATTVSLSSSSSAAIVPATVTVQPGDRGASFTITTAAVTTPATVTISASLNGVTQSSPLTITPAVYLSGVSLNPSSVGGGGSSTGTITLSGPAPSSGIVVYLVSNNASATVPASVTVPTGSSSALFTITTSSVTSAVTGNIVAIYNYITATAPLTVTNGPIVSLSSVSLNPTSVQGGTSSTGTVTLSGAAPTGGITVSLTSNSSAATVPASVTVASGNTTANFTVATTAVTSTTTAAIGAAYNGVTQTANLTITPPAVTVTLTGLSLNPTSVPGGTSSTGTVTLSGAAPTAGIVVTLSSNSSSATVPANVTVTSGNTTANFTITTKTVASSTTAAIGASYNSVTKSANLTITPPALSSLTLSPTSVQGGTSSTGTVTLSGPAPTAGISVTLSSNSSSATVPASVTVTSGNTTATFTITTKAVTTSTTAAIKATFNSVSQTANLTITPAAAVTLSSVALNPTSVPGGSNSTGTVTLSGPAPTNGVSVSLSSNSSSATVPATVTVTSGNTTATFTVTTKSVTASTTATISAVYSGVTKTASLTITPATGTATLTGLTLSPATVGGGSPATGTVTLSAAAPAAGIVVSLSSNNALAAVPANVTVTQGNSSATFTITTNAGNYTAHPAITATYNSTSYVSTLVIVGFSGLSISPSAVNAGTSATGTVTLTQAAPTGGMVISLSSSNAAATVPATVTVASGSTTATFTITTNPVTVSTDLTITASVGGASDAEGLTVNPATGSPGYMTNFTLSPSSITAGQTSTGTVTISVAAPTGGATITLSSNNPVATVPASFTIPAGSTTASFTITTSSSLNYTALPSITASYAGVNWSETLTIAP